VQILYTAFANLPTSKIPCLKISDRLANSGHFYGVRNPPSLVYLNVFFPIFAILQPRLTLRNLGLGFATLLILIRSSFRVAELSEGFGSALANNEVTFMVLEGGMVASAVILLTAMHPGLVFERKGWKEAGWTLSGKPTKRGVSEDKSEKVTRGSE